MARVILLGAGGSLGRHALRQALAAGHEVAVFVRTPSKLPPEARGQVSVHTGDLSALVPSVTFNLNRSMGVQGEFGSMPRGLLHLFPVQR